MVHTEAEVPQSTRSSIAGGFVLVPVAALMACWRASEAAPLGIGDFRAWLACHEMKARRCRAEEGWAVAFSTAELAAGLLGVSERRVRASIRRLVAAGLVEWGEGAIGFPLPGCADPDLEDSIGRGRGSVAIPRRMLRHLAAGARPALIATVLGLLLRCLSRRRDGFDGRGRVKSSWIARTFGIDLRRVKAARRELIDLGWIEPEASGQIAENRWGRAYRIDLAWDRHGPGGKSLPSLPPANRREIATPSLDQDLSRRGNDQNQEPAGGSAGFSIEGPGDGDKPRPKAVHTDSVPSGIKPVSALPSPTLADIRPEDLKDTTRLLDLHRQAIDRKLIGASEADRLRFVAAAEHAMAIGKANPCGLFAYLVRGACWRYITQADEDRANGRIKAYLRGPELPRVATATPARPMLSEDAGTVLGVRRALAAAGYRGDPFPQVRRHDASWTRERWDRAAAELGAAS